MTTALLQLTADSTDHWDGPPWPFFPIFPILWLLVVGTFIYVVSRRWGGGRHDAVGTVRDLYARGEISADEMRQRLDTLKANRR
ncbi:hypothetical protein PZ938_17795 [Luteipulveratus sp. YIM 133132]|uniref:hypothetical protein n=1 Tax=Luteipulveratus flavus TaxID=3031728 RepID=UPI0023B195AC|nr:hypothetical protein [Luteipulveratus sp. YIM 133132]MDE9367478.1 hypothetical protein [Luteipulveratus sp. YIM 133132]